MEREAQKEVLNVFPPKAKNLTQIRVLTGTKIKLDKKK